MGNELKADGDVVLDGIEMNVDDEDPVIVASESPAAKQIDNILKQQLAAINLNAVLVHEDGKLKIKCTVCLAQTDIGKSNKWSNYKRHLSSTIHTMAEEGVSPEDVAFKALDKAHPNVFVEKGNHAVCSLSRKRSKWEVTVSLLANNFLTNAKHHVNMRHTSKHQTRHLQR